MKKQVIYITVILFSSTCIAGTFLFLESPKVKFQTAQKLERQGKIKAALKKYEELVSRSVPEEIKSASLFYLARIYKERLNDYTKARQIYSKLVTEYPQNKFTSTVHDETATCFAYFKYFPLKVGNYWTEGDSQTGGKNYLRRIECVRYRNVFNNPVFTLEDKVTSGNKPVNSQQTIYTSDETNFWQYTDNARMVMFKYPLTIGTTWTVKEGKNLFEYSIISTTATVQTNKYEFTECLKLKMRNRTLPGAYCYEYYAPYVGKVLTTHATNTNNIEYPITELISYHVKK